jgi:ABC-type Fe3+-hydroxamate transport system substrate-binding protein
MLIFLTLFSLIALFGCTQQQPTKTETPSKAASTPIDDMLRSGDPHFSVEELRIVAAAQAYLEKIEQILVDARYRVKQTRDGYEVFVMFVDAYSNGIPLYSPGGHCIVILHSNGSVVRYIPGE